MSQVTGLSGIPPQSFYRYNKPEARPYTVVALDPEHGDFGPFTPGTKTSGLQEAINFVASLGGGEIFIKNNGGAGYPLYVDVEPPVGVPIKLSGDYTRLYAAASGLTMIHLTQGTNPLQLPLYLLDLEGLQLDGNGLAATCVGTALNAVSGVWRDCSFFNCAPGHPAVQVNTYKWLSEGCYYQNVGSGDTFDVGPYYGTTFVGNTFTNAGSGGDLSTGGIAAGVTINGVPADMGLEVVGNTFIGPSSSAGEGLFLESGYLNINGQPQNIKNVVVDGNTFINGAPGLFAVSSSLGLVEDIVFTNNVIKNAPLTVNTPVSRLIIKGNTIKDSPQAGIFVANAGVSTPIIHDLVIEGNTIENSNLGQNTSNLQNYAGISIATVSSAIIRGNTFRRTDTTTYGTPAFIAVNSLGSIAVTGNVIIEGNTFVGTPSQWNNILIFNVGPLPNIYIQDNINAIPVVVGTYQNATPNTPGSVLFFHLRRNPNPSGFAGITQLASGTTYQNPYPFSLTLLIPVTLTPTSTAAASATISVGTSPSTLSAVQTLSAAAGASPTGGVLQASVPSGQYYQITLTNATAYQPIVLT